MNVSTRNPSRRTAIMQNMINYADELIKKLSSFACVDAIALGGSRAGDAFDEKSDYDVYVYCKTRIPDGERVKILEEYCNRIEAGNSFWEYEDNCVLKDGLGIDLIYRDLDGFAADVSDVVDKFHARNGYTTCMWHNLITCRILYDKEGKLAELQKKYSRPFPEELKRNIIERNLKLLRFGIPAYEEQILKAVSRGDEVSINHRVTEFLASYFDIIFAVNGLTHPGEKRLSELCEKQCKLLPANFRGNIHKLFSDMFKKPESLSDDLNTITNELLKIIN